MEAQKTKGELLKEAVTHERAGRWSMAADATARARGAKPSAAARDGRADGASLTPGAVLRHMRWGKCEAECAYVEEGVYVFGGETFSSLLDVTRAAAKALGKKTTARPNALRFWGLAAQVQDDPRGFDQDRHDSDLPEEAEVEALEPDFTASSESAVDEGVE